MFMDQKNQYSENEYNTQSNLQIQCNPYQATSSIFHRARTNTVGSLIGIALNLQIALGSILIFTILIFLINEHGIFLHLLVSSWISFTNVLQFSLYRSLVSLVRYIPKYFILFIAMVNGIVSLISLSILLLIVYRNPIIRNYLKLSWRVRSMFDEYLTQFLYMN